MKLNGRVLYEAWVWELKPARVVNSWEGLSEVDRQAWDALARAIDRSPPVAVGVQPEAIARFERMIGSSVMMDYAHHRSCAIRRGGNECTC